LDVAEDATVVGSAAVDAADGAAGVGGAAGVVAVVIGVEVT
jgi:hypothetical protein